MPDPTEPIRRMMLEDQRITQEAVGDDDALEAMLRKEYGQLWDTKQLQEDFVVTSFLAPFVMVNRKSDGKRGTLMFNHMPRWYYFFQES